MGLIMTDFSQWICEHCSTKEDLQFYKNKLQEIENNWIDENEEEDRIFNISIDFQAPSNFNEAKLIISLTELFTELGYNITGLSREYSWNLEEYGIKEK